MPFEERNKVELRKEFVREALREQEPLSVASGRDLRVAVGKRILTCDERVGGVPHHLQIRMVQRRENAGGLGGSGNIAGVLVLQSNRDAVWGRLIGEVAQRTHDPLEALVRLDRPPDLASGIIRRA